MVIEESPEMFRGEKIEGKWVGNRRKFKNEDGYLCFFIYRKGKPIMVKVHRYVMENKIGRPLSCNEIVHHVDGNKRNNSPDNLAIVKSFSNHASKYKNQNTKCLLCDRQAICRHLCRKHYQQWYLKKIKIEAPLEPHKHFV